MKHLPLRCKLHYIRSRKARPCYSHCRGGLRFWRCSFVYGKQTNISDSFVISSRNRSPIEAATFCPRRPNGSLSHNTCICSLVSDGKLDELLGVTESPSEISPIAEGVIFLC